MIDFNLVWLLSLIGLILSFFLLILAGRLFYKPIDNSKNIFSRIFPFELINNLGNGFNFYKVILFILSAFMFSPIFAVVGNYGLFENFIGYEVFISCIYGFAGILYVFLHFFNPSNVKTHLILVTIFVAMTFLAGVLSGTLSVNIALLETRNGFGLPINIVFGVISFACSLSIVLLTLFIKLKNWAKLNINDADQSLSRPNVFPLALLEWSTFFILLIEEVSYFFVLINL